MGLSKAVDIDLFIAQESDPILVYRASRLLAEAQVRNTKLPAEATEIAPDGSEIRKLLEIPNRGGVCHCTLPAGAVSSPVVHSKIDEIWYVVEGEGEIWRKVDGAGSFVDLKPGTSVSIPAHAAFQFRNTGTAPLCMIIATMPPWPGAQEATSTQRPWPVRSTRLPGRSETREKHSRKLRLPPRLTQMVRHYSPVVQEDRFGHSLGTNATDKGGIEQWEGRVQIKQTFVLNRLTVMGWLEGFEPSATGTTIQRSTS
jgi:mannose-6-phosphate isomerase-like protein (cupin superfamily)